MTGIGFVCYIMKIIAVSDIHGHYAEIDEILVQEQDFDVLVLAGDLTNQGKPAEAEAAVMSFQRYGKPVFVVAGNMDLPGTEERFQALGAGLNARGIIIGETGFFGVSGSPPTLFRTPYEISEEEIARRLEEGWRAVERTRHRILVPHAPPYRTKLDRTYIGMHVGSKAVREFVTHRRPDILICGHIHEARGVDTLGATRMVNCGQGGRGQYAVIEVGETIQVENRG